MAGRNLHQRSRCPRKAERLDSRLPVHAAVPTFPEAGKTFTQERRKNHSCGHRPKEREDVLSGSSQDRGKLGEQTKGPKRDQFFDELQGVGENIPSISQVTPKIFGRVQEENEPPSLLSP